MGFSLAKRSRFVPILLFDFTFIAGRFKGVVSFLRDFLGGCMRGDVSILGENAGESGGGGRTGEWVHCCTGGYGAMTGALAGGAVHLDLVLPPFFSFALFLGVEETVKWDAALQSALVLCPSFFSTSPLLQGVSKVLFPFFGLFWGLYERRCVNTWRK